MKTFFPRSMSLFIAVFIALQMQGAGSVKAQSDDEAQRLANGFARESENDQRARKRTAARKAAQLAAEKSAMQAARREAAAAKDNAQLQAYRKELMERVRREAAQHRKAAEALVKEREREVAAQKAASTKKTAQAKKIELAKRKALANKRKALAQSRAAQLKKAAGKKAARNKTARNKALGSNKNKPKYVILNAQPEGGAKRDRIKSRAAAKSRATAKSKAAAANEAPAKLAQPDIKQSKPVFAARPPAKNTDLESLALQAESARLSKLEQAREAELFDLDQKLARIAAKRDADKAAKKKAQNNAGIKQAARDRAKKIAAAQAEAERKSARLAEAKASADTETRLEAQRLQRNKRAMAESAQRRAERTAAQRETISAQRRVEVLSGRTQRRTARSNAAWERQEAARLTREAARRFSDQLAARERARLNTRRRDVSRGETEFRNRENVIRNENAYVDGPRNDTPSARGYDSNYGNARDEFRRAERSAPRRNEYTRRDFPDQRQPADESDPSGSAQERFARREQTGRFNLGRDVGIERNNVATLPPRYSPAEPTQPDMPAARARPSSVTVLLIMKPGKRGIRRFKKTADPILCAGGGCYISQGAGVAARFVKRRRALGPKNTFGRRAGACNRRLGCIFRNVRLGRNALILQPVDLRILRHDRRARQVVDAPSRCEVNAGRLSCSNAFNARDYEMWVVPEYVASQAGAQGLEAALAGGLRTRTASPRAGADFSEAGYNFRSSDRY